MKKLFFILLFSLSSFAQVTPNLGLNLPSRGTLNWDTPLNANFTAIDNYLSGGLTLPSLDTSYLTTAGESVNGIITVASSAFPNNRLEVYTGPLGGDGRLEQYNSSSVLVSALYFGNTGLGGFASSTGFLLVWPVNTILEVGASVANIGGVGAGIVFPGGNRGNVQLVVPDVIVDTGGSTINAVVTLPATQGGLQVANAFVFSYLPACASGTEGTLRGVTDSTTNTWGATITGSGTNHVMAYCDGTNWTVSAK